MQIGNILLRYIVVILLATTLPTAAISANGLKIAHVEVDGAKVDESIELYLTKPNQRRKLTEIRRGTEIPQGSIIETPARTRLIFSSNGKNVGVLGPGSTLRVKTISDAGQSFSVLAGKVWFSIKSSLNFFNVTDGSQRFRASVEGTNLAVEVKNGAIQFERGSGEIRVSRQLQLRLGQNSGPDSRASKSLPRTWVANVLDARNQSAEFNLKHANRQFRSFRTLSEAKARLQGEIDRNFPELEAADAALTLGYLNLENDDASAAIELFELAFLIQQNLLPANAPAFVETETAIGKAYLAADQAATAIKHLTRAADIYAVNHPHETDSAIAETYASLGRAYAAAGGNDGIAGEWKQRAVRLARQEVKFASAYLKALSDDRTPDSRLAEDKMSTALMISSDYSLLGRIHEINGDRDGGEQYLDNAARFSSLADHIDFDDLSDDDIYDTFEDPPGWDDQSVGLYDVMDDQYNFEGLEDEETFAAGDDLSEDASLDDVEIDEVEAADFGDEFSEAFDDFSLDDEDLDDYSESDFDDGEDFGDDTGDDYGDDDESDYSDDDGGYGDDDGGYGGDDGGYGGDDGGGYGGDDGGDDGGDGGDSGW